MRSWTSKSRPWTRCPASATRGTLHVYAVTHVEFRHTVRWLLPDPAVPSTLEGYNLVTTVMEGNRGRGCLPGCPAAIRGRHSAAGLDQRSFVSLPSVLLFSCAARSARIKVVKDVTQPVDSRQG